MVIDVLSLDRSGDDFLGGLVSVSGRIIVGEVVINLLVGGTGSINRFVTQIGGVLLCVCDLECVRVHVESGEAVLGLTDYLDLVICQVEISGKAVSCDCVRFIQTSGGNCVRQIDPEKIVFPEHSVFVCFLPVCNLFAAVCFCIIFRSVIVDCGAAVEKLLEIKLFKRGHIALGGCLCRVEGS